MARRHLSREDEERRIAEAEEARDSDEPLGRARRVDRGPSPTSVVSVRLPLERARELRRIATERGQSLSELLQDAVDALLTEPPSRLTRSEGLTLVARFSAPTELGSQPAAPTEVRTAGTDE